MYHNLRESCLLDHTYCHMKLVFLRWKCILFVVKHIFPSHILMIFFKNNESFMIMHVLDGLTLFKVIIIFSLLFNLYLVNLSFVNCINHIITVITRLKRFCLYKFLFLISWIFTIYKNLRRDQFCLLHRQMRWSRNKTSQLWLKLYCVQLSP